MGNLYFKLIDLSDKEQVLDFISEMVSDGSNINGVWYEDEETFEDMIIQLKKHEKIIFENYEQEIPVNYQYLLLRENDNRLIGMFSIRPFLTRRLDEGFGGSIGYSIRPTERRKGYAAEGLRLAIDICKKINNDKIIICCDKDNVGSRKVILKNGGKLIEEKPAIITVQKYLIE